MRSIFGILAIIFFLTGCSKPVTDPISPSIETRQPIAHDNFLLWGEWDFYFSADHGSLDIVPKRQGRLHLNALKFLEEYCTDCLDVTGIENNGDGTIDLTLRITHPFPNSPQYTGFDVKGIIMFEGSYSVPWWSELLYPYGESSDWSYFHISWAEVGDPEVLNQDGYTVRWSPYWDSGSSMPIFNYYEGKYTNGIPTANINAYKNFYTHEERHIFMVDGSVERVYTISLPPGPVVAGYAVEACWEPPTVTPVTDPLNDFPETANQEEPYYFRFIVNNDEPITEEVLPVENPDGCANIWYEWRQWHGKPPTKGAETWPDDPEDWIIWMASPIHLCEPEPGSNLVRRYRDGSYKLHMKYDGQSGKYRGVTVYFGYGFDFIPFSIVYDVFDFELDYD